MVVPAGHCLCLALGMKIAGCKDADVNAARHGQEQNTSSLWARECGTLVMISHMAKGRGSSAFCRGPELAVGHVLQGGTMKRSPNS